MIKRERSVSVRCASASLRAVFVLASVFTLPAMPFADDLLRVPSAPGPQEATTVFVSRHLCNVEGLDGCVEFDIYPSSFGSTTSSSLLETTTTEISTTTTTTTTTTTVTTTSTTIPFAQQSCGDPIPDADVVFGAALVTATDALFTLNVAVGLQNCRECICDVNGSGVTTSTDALAVLNLAVGIETALLCPAC